MAVGRQSNPSGCTEFVILVSAIPAGCLATFSVGASSHEPPLLLTAHFDSGSYFDSFTPSSCATQDLLILHMDYGVCYCNTGIATSWTLVGRWTHGSGWIVTRLAGCNSITGQPLQSCKWEC